MVNWLKVSGIVLMVIGVIILLGSSLVIVYTPSEDSHTFPRADVTGIYVGGVLGIPLFLVGLFLYYFGTKKEKKSVLASSQKSP